ncbi:MAG: protein DA1 [Candidatus Sericytochromatia bacterium]|nr:protein DA1 [Candidatus Tanganyikabacteria bacterium]
MKCAGCRLPIEQGGYVNAGNLPFHERCLVCCQCGQVLTRFAIERGRFYCHECHVAAFAPRCKVCALPIEGTYYEHDGGKAHAECYRKHVAGKCDVCGGPLVGKILSDGWGFRYHEAHAAQFPACDACGRLTSPEIGGGGHRLGDGRHLCGHCRPSAVRNAEEARERFAEVRAFLAQRGLVVPGAALPLHLVSRPDLMKTLARSGHPPRKAVHGVTLMEARIQGSRVVSREASIHVLTYLPAALFDGTAAHELGHAWTFLTGCPQHVYALSEGFCNYLRYLVHTAEGGDENAFYVKHMLDDPDPAYGHGFRIVRKIAERKGFPALLDHMRRKTDFPLFGW